MFTRKFNPIVIDDIEVISENQLDALKSSGFCYIKVDCEEKHNGIDSIRESMLTFFRSDMQTKEKLLFLKEKFLSKEKVNDPSYFLQGYLNRNTKKSSLETFKQRIDMKLLPPLENCESEVNAVQSGVIRPIVENLLGKIIRSVSFDNAKEKFHHFEDVTLWLQFAYYPRQTYLQKAVDLPGFHAHKDISYSTVIFLDKPGLKIWQDGAWQDILPKPGYAVFLLGSDLSAITDNRVRSCLHYVSMRNISERSSLVFFISPNRSNALFSLSGAKLHDPGMSLIDRDRVDSINKADVENFFMTLNVLINLLGFSTIIGALKLSKTGGELSVTQATYSLISSFLLINFTLKLFDIFYFDRLKTDYLQHPSFPYYGTDEQIKAYNLGKSSLSFAGFFNSIGDKNSYKNRSFWNAGLLSQLVKR